MFDGFDRFVFALLAGTRKIKRAASCVASAAFARTLSLFPVSVFGCLFRNAMTFRFGSAVQAAPMTRVNRHTNYM